MLTRADQGVSDQQRNQILGHARSETFLKHYLSSSVIIDVQATFLGQESKSDLIKEMGRLALRRDPNLPKELTPAEKQQAHQDKDLIEAKANFEELSKKLRHEYGQINKAPAGSEDLLKRNALRTQIISLKSKCERKAFQEILENFHSNADLEQMVLQLKGEKPMKLSMLEPTQHALPERKELAELLFVPADSSTFPRIVNTMARLCDLRQPQSTTEDNIYPPPELDEEPPVMAELLVPRTDNLPVMLDYQSMGLPMINLPSEMQHQVGSDCSTVESATTNANIATVAVPPHPDPASEVSSSLPGKEHKRGRSTSAKLGKKTKSSAGTVCLFCYNEKSTKNHLFRRDNLRRHYRTTHFQHQVGAFPCPVSKCETIIGDPDHFSRHASSAHRSNLGVRASIMQVIPYEIRPGQLRGFRL